MAHTHEFDCKVCGAHLDSSEELAQHTKKQHSQTASSSSSTSNQNPSRPGTSGR
jgi:hypothetical protein